MLEEQCSTGVNEQLGGGDSGMFPPPESKKFMNYVIYGICILILTAFVYGMITTYSLNTKVERFIKNLKRGL